MIQEVKIWEEAKAAGLVDSKNDLGATDVADDVDEVADLEEAEDEADVADEANEVNKAKCNGQLPPSQWYNSPG